MRNLFCCLCLLISLWALQGCGHAGKTADQYTETIYWEEGTAEWNGPDELSDSELLAEEIAEEESPGEDTLGSNESESVEDIVLANANTNADEPENHPVIRKGGQGRIPLRQIGRLHEIFNDSNHYQLEHARRLGVEPMRDIASYYNTRRPIVKIETNKDFVVDELRHSYPYLVPEAAQLLHDIGRNFQDSLASRKGGNYRIIVTSVLRTPVTVKRLRRVNGNATQESTHQYGTTFDITYTRFDPVDGKDVNTQGDLKNLLGEVLHDLHRQGRCMVKYERKSPCYHITVVK